VQQGWDPGRLNDVVIMTDGANDNPGGLTLNQLLGKLHEVADPRRPVQVIAIGIGNDVGVQELHSIVQVTGGRVLTVADPAKIGDSFLQAISSRPS
jgi:hypothetical protein